MNQSTLAKDICQRYLSDMAKSVGALDVIFVLDFKEPQLWLGKRWYNGIKNRSSLLYSSPKIQHLNSMTRNRIKLVDLDIIKSVEKPTHVWFYNKSSKQQFNSSKSLVEFGYGKQISISVDLHRSSQLKAIFNFFYNNENETSDLERISKLENHRALLQLLANQITSTKILDSPIEDYQLFRPATISIIRDLAKGSSRQQLSKDHFMSTRGVDYHIEKAKTVLRATNGSNLVHVAHDMLLI